MATTPSTSTQSQQPPVIVDKEDNEYVLVVKKRIRNYKKKLTNISSIEAKVAKKESINKEQEEALRAKDSTTKIVQELENIEGQLLQIKKQEQQKQFSLEDVKNLILLFQSQQIVSQKRPEGLTDQQFKHLTSSANSLSKHNTKWSLDETCRHALKLVRDSDIKTGLSKAFHVDPSKAEAPVESKEGKAEMTPSQSQEAPVTTTTTTTTTPTTVVTPQQPEVPTTTTTASTATPTSEQTKPATDGASATTAPESEEQQFTTGRGSHRGRSGSGKFSKSGSGGGSRRGSFNNNNGGGEGGNKSGSFKKQYSNENKGEARRGGSGGPRPPKQTTSAPAPQN